MKETISSEKPWWEQFSHFFTPQEIPAKTTLLQEGQVSKTAYFIEKGCLRLSFNNNGKDITFQFFFEGEIVSSIESFRGNQPSLFSLESIEPSVVRSVSKIDMESIFVTSPEIKSAIEEQTFQRLIFYQKLFLSRIKDNPEKRYNELLTEYPQILQRVPQHYIASYLGITPVSLSRIRNRR
ncbi:Crp/Fnr family transcriptional regulator [Algoriphagus sp. Y33]|uniref:Crp/Fnr family transcriptional regulator n=1 Tax=Algoriphagus sp. Y33 TaxID=2772483 RepID=UPI00177ACE08|nr:Crp/Fnr family transcriptional regulator [Algoriphagus sp. Y33]